jgi:predicted nucleic acid-binding protein
MSAFFDTNIFVYADDGSAPKKQACAIDLIAKHRLKNEALVSLQVLQEYFAIVTRKLNVDPAVAQRKVELMSHMHVVRFQPEDVIRAIELHRIHPISFWDAMIVHAARSGGAETLFTEVMHDRMRFGKLRIVNPFARP